MHSSTMVDVTIAIAITTPIIMGVVMIVILSLSDDFSLYFSVPGLP